MDNTTHIANRNHGRSRGFTLIETMLATGIVGTLSAVAVPVYQDYIARAEIVQTVTDLSAAKTAIAESVTTTGAIPETMRAPFSADTIASVTLYRYSNCPAQGGIEVQLTGSGISPALQNKTVRLQYDDAGRWTCSQGATSAVPESLLPRACRNAAESIPEGCGTIEYSTLSMNVAGSSGDNASNSFGDADWSGGYGGGSDAFSEDYSSADDEDEFDIETMEWEQAASSGSTSSSSTSNGSGSSSATTGSTGTGGANSGGDSPAANDSNVDNENCEDQFEGANESGSNDAMLTAEGGEECLY